MRVRPATYVSYSSWMEMRYMRSLRSAKRSGGVTLSCSMCLMKHDRAAKSMAGPYLAETWARIQPPALEIATTAPLRAGGRRT